MEFELDQSSKRLERQREQAKRKTERERKEEERARAAFAEVERRREEGRRVREQQEAKMREEEQLGNGVSYVAFLTPKPMERNLETDKIVLPPSALETLLAKDALNKSSSPFTFCLELVRKSDRVVISRTHSGVSEFAAREGEVMLPMKTAYSLVKDVCTVDEAFDAVNGQYMLRVRYFPIERHDRAVARIQPLGEGFHTGGVESVNVDLRALFMRFMRTQTVLSQGDYIPLRHEGITYLLVVRELLPEPQVVLVDTELEIDLLPSEAVERRAREKEATKALLAERKERAGVMFSRLRGEETIDPKDAIAIRCRVGHGIMSRRFSRTSSTMEEVFLWIESQVGMAGEFPGDDEANGKIVRDIPPFALVQSWPGHVVTFSSRDDGVKRKKLSELGLSGKVENLNFKWEIPLAGDVATTTTVKREDNIAAPSTTTTTKRVEGIWKKAELVATTSLDEEINMMTQRNQGRTDRDDDVGEGDEAVTEQQSASGGETAHSPAEILKHLIHNCHVSSPPDAARAVQTNPEAFSALLAMDLLNSREEADLAVGLVLKYKSGTQRIVHGMVEGKSSSPASSLMEEISSERWSGELEIIRGMGFNVDGSSGEEARALLDRYAGSVDRVVGELLAKSSS